MATRARNLERYTGLGQRALDPHDALGNRRRRHQERARNLLGGQAAEQTQRDRNARLGGEYRMACGEDQTQQIVADVVVDRGIQTGLGLRLTDFVL